MLTAAEIELIMVGVDALVKIVEGNKEGGAPATQADVDTAKKRLDEAKTKLDQAIESQEE